MEGKVISSRKEDLINMTDHFLISIENPLAILTQDTARQFLSNSTAKDKYLFFLKGTQLDKLQEIITTLSNQVSAMKDAINVKQDVRLIS
jgi:hypothetical protein